jgi:tetratricopeptide (TPR) repeat protein
MQAYQNSLQIKRRVLGNDNLSVGKTLNNLGTVHYLKRDYEKALEAYQEALQIMKASLGPYHLDVGTVYSNIGDVYWAQSGEVRIGDEVGSPQRYYQASRDAALQHYRRSLEIRWEQLQDHHDPKVIRLLEKIAALEMGESFLALVQNNRKYRPAAMGGSSSKDGNDPTNESAQLQVGNLNDDDDDPIEAESSKPVAKELQNLNEELKKDVKVMDLMERKMAIDMVKDKLRLLREMKNLSNLNVYASDDESSSSEEAQVRTPRLKAPLSPVQRTEALSAVKERLHTLREQRRCGTNPSAGHYGSSDLKEADRSPHHHTLSHRASQLLQRAYHHQPGASLSPENGLDDLRKFSFLGAIDSEDKDDENSAEGNFAAVGTRASNTLVEGIDALRNLSLNQDMAVANTTLTKPWLVNAAATAQSSAVAEQGSHVLSTSLAEF